MFDEIRKRLDEFESAIEKNELKHTEEDRNIIKYFDLHLAEAIIKDKCCDSKTIAKVILGWTGE